jgi:hypothetical protein
MSQKYKVVMILTQDEMDDMAGALITTDVSVGGRVHQIADDLRELAGKEGCTNDIFVTKVIG